MNYILTEQQVEKLKDNLTFDEKIEQILEMTSKFNHQEKLKLLLEMTSDFTYEEKLKFVFKLIPWNDFHNYRYREEVAARALGLPPKLNRKMTGDDYPDLSLKSIRSKQVSKRTGKVEMTPKDRLGAWGRLDLNNSKDLKDTVIDVWGDEGVILRIKVYFGEEFLNLYNTKKELIQKVKYDKENKVDMSQIKLKDFIEYRVPFEVLYVDDDKVNLSKDFPIRYLIPEKN